MVSRPAYQRDGTLHVGMTLTRCTYKSLINSNTHVLSHLAILISSSFSLMAKVTAVFAFPVLEQHLTFTLLPKPYIANIWLAIEHLQRLLWILICFLMSEMRFRQKTSVLPHMCSE